MKNSRATEQPAAPFIGTGAEPFYFYQRFREGRVLDPDLPRITSRHTEAQFAIVDVPLLQASIAGKLFNDGFPL